MSEEREVLDLDVVFVGAGPASLAGAYHLANLIEEHNARGEGEELEPMIAVLEKGQEIGSHALSGAVIDPGSLQELMGDEWEDAPFEGRIEREKFQFMTSGKAISLPVPPPLVNKGKYVVSLGKLLKWLAPKVEEKGVDILCEFPASEILVDEDTKKVIGVRTGDKGIGHDGKPRPSHEPGVDIHAQAVVLGEGPRGTLTLQLEKKFDLMAGKNPMVYGVGLKEIWEVPEGRMAPGDVIHTLGWPLDSETYGGSFIYGMKDNQIIVGLVVGLDYKNPHLDPHTEFQRFKTHPEVRRLIEGGKMLFYGAKAIPMGGWWAMPKNHGDGFLICGDSGGFLNAQRLKGIHTAIKSGMLAAEAIFEGLKEGEVKASHLAKYQEKVEASWLRKELYGVRNFHQGFDRGRLAGMVNTGLGLVTGGRGWGLFDRLETHPGHERMDKVGNGRKAPEAVDFDNELTFDKLTDVYNSGTAHEEDQPVHLLVSDTDLCVTRCAEEYGNPCVRFCPAAVYEIVDDAETDAGKRLQINASNCVHCKTCDIMDPYQVITWVPPEGGGGPNYSKM